MCVCLWAHQQHHPLPGSSFSFVHETAGGQVAVQNAAQKAMYVLNELSQHHLPIPIQELLLPDDSQHVLETLSKMRGEVHRAFAVWGACMQNAIIKSY